MKSVILSVLMFVSAIVLGANHFVWAGYAIYLMVSESVGFWSSVGQCFGGWALTTISSLIVFVVTYAALKK